MATINLDKLKLDLDTRSAEQAADKFKAQFISDLKEAIKSGKAEFKEFASFTDQQLSDLATKADASFGATGQSAKKQAEGMQKAFASMTSQGLGLFGDLKDSFGMVSESLLGLSKAQSETVTEAADQIEKFGQLGSALGPVGTVAGVVAGGILSAAEQLKKLNDEMPKSAARIQELLVGTKEQEGSWYKNTVAMQGFRQGMSQVINESEKGSGSFLDLGAAGKGMGQVMNWLGFETYPDLKKQSEDLRETLIKERNAAIELSDTYKDYRRASKDFASSINEAWAELDKRDAQEKADKAERASQKRVRRIQEEVRAYEQLFGLRENFAEESMLDTGGLSEAREEASGLAQETASLASAFEEANESMLDFEGMREGFSEAREEIQLTAQELEKLQLTFAERLQHSFDLTQTQSEALADTVKSLGQSFASDIGGLAADSVGLLFDRIETGQKNTEQQLGKMISGFLRATGEKLIADGTFNSLAGAAKSLMGDPTGPPLVALGLTELGAGAALGASGAGLGRRFPGKDSSSSSSGGSGLGRANNNTPSGPIVSTPVIVNLGMMTVSDRRSLQNAGKEISRAVNAYQGGI